MASATNCARRIHSEVEHRRNGRPVLHDNRRCRNTDCSLEGLGANQLRRIAVGKKRRRRLEGLDAGYHIRSELVDNTVNIELRDEAARGFRSRESSRGHLRDLSKC